MKKVLLSMATLAFIMSANAQLLTYDFETVDESKIVAENWTDFSDSQYDFSKAGVGVDGSKALYANTTGTCQTYQRVIALKNVGVGENKAYKISLQAKGTGTINVGILKGCFYHDKALLLNGNDQVKDFAVESADEFKTIEYQVWAPSRSVMAAANSDFNQDEYWNQDFLRLSFDAEGETYVDNVVVEEVAPVSAAVFNGNAAKISFLGPTNLAALAAEGPVELDNSCVTLKIDGEESEVDIVELKQDGALYIFFADYLNDESSVEITFNNGVGFKYTDNDAEIQKFTVTGVYDSDFAASATAYEEAQLVVANPEDESFEISNSIASFSFTFNKPVSTDDEENGKPTAVLVGPGINEDLVVVANEELSTTLVFKRTSTAALPDGMYTITLDNVSNEMSVATTNPFVVTFETGTVSLGTVTYTDVTSVWMEGTYGEAQPTNGWISYFNGDVNSSNANRVGNMVTNEKGVGFYFCQRDGSVPAKLTFGEKDDAPFTLPAGDVQITFYATKWQGAGGTFSYQLVKKTEAMDEVVASGSLAAEGNTGGFEETVTSIPGMAVKMPGMVAGDYVLILETAAGWSGTIFYGVDVKTYKEEGPKADPDVLINETFASVENGKVPAAGTGWSVYDNNNIGAKGEAQSGRNRMMSTGSCSNMSIGFYNRCFGDPAAYYLTYGEPAPEGQETPEPEFILENAKYSFSWYAVNWKGDKQTYYFQLIDAETGVVEYEMTPVEVTANVNGGANTVEAVQIQFNYVPQGGKYIMKWWMTGEAIIGKIRVEKMGSLAVYWKNKLINDGLSKAIEERENANADEFAGTTRDNLDAVITKNTNPSDYHTPREYQAGIDECLAAAKAMAARRAAIAAYKTDIEKLATTLAEIDAKYEKLEIIPELKNIVEKYGEVDPSTLEDEELLPVQAKITTGVSAVKNVIDVINNLITKQIHNLLDVISVYGDKLDDEFSLGWIAKGDEALTDDQRIAGELQQILTACIYDSIANGYNFSYYDEEAELTLPDSIDITGYIANNMFYTVNPQKTYQGPAANAAFPGWNITEGDVSNVWWWEGTLAIDATKPAVDASLRNTGNNAFKVNQALKNLPVGVYTMVMKTADCSNVADVSTTYAKKDESLPWSNSEVYAKVGEDVISVEANYGEGQVWRNAANTYLMNIQGTAAEGEKTVAMTIGANMNCTNDAAQVDDTKLFMVGKLEGFDYRAAADAIFANIPSDLKAVERTDAPVAVQYFNLAGQKSAAQGVNIKVETYSDGYTVVKKVLVK